MDCRGGDERTLIHPSLNVLNFGGSSTNVEISFFMFLTLLKRSKHVQVTASPCAWECGRGHAKGHALIHVQHKQTGRLVHLRLSGNDAGANRLQGRRRGRHHGWE
jgi:hypothetical protein